MKDCARKLGQERGASVVFALVIFLIVTIFSWTMVNGALTAAQNASMQREEEQAYLSVTSAARLFCQEATLKTAYTIPVPSGAYSEPFNPGQIWDNPALGTLSWKFIDSMDKICLVRENPDLTMTVYVHKTEADSPDHISSLQASPLNLIQETFLAMMQEVDKEGSAPPETLILAYPQKTSESGLALFHRVEIAVEMKPEDYSVKVDFRTKENEREDSPSLSENLKYYVSVRFRCQKGEENTTEPDGTVKASRTIEWYVDSVERGRAA